MIDSTTLPLAPTRVRYAVLGMLCLLAMITYLDRAMYGSAKGDIMAAVHEPVENFFYLLVAFQVAYALFEVPTGWMGDTFGPRATLLRIVLWWSFFIALTACAGMAIPGLESIGLGFTAIVVVQFLFGVGEAGAFPNITRALYNWFPATQRGTAQGTIWLAARFMGGLTPMVWVLMTDAQLGGLTWRQALWLFAGAAALWCLIFWLWFRNQPGQHPAVNQAERNLIDAGRQPAVGHRGVPWKKLLGSSNLWFICAMYMVTNFCWYFLLFFLPGVLKDRFMDRTGSAGGRLLVALMAGAPLLVGMLGCVLGGFLSDRYVQRTGDRKWGRRLFPLVGYTMAGVSYLLAAFAKENFWTFAALIMAMGFFNDLMMGSAWATCQDVGRRYAATVSGCMNMIGNLGATLGNLVTGAVFAIYKDDQATAINIMFPTYFVLYVIGALLWLKIDASKPIVPDPPAGVEGVVVLDE